MGRSTNLFFLKNIFFSQKGVTETFDTENNTSLVNLGFRGDATLNNSLYLALANITRFHLEKLFHMHDCVMRLNGGVIGEHCGTMRHLYFVTAKVIDGWLYVVLKV